MRHVETAASRLGGAGARDPRATSRPSAAAAVTDGARRRRDGRRRARRGIIAEINVTPLVDIMLVLLIIFMLTAHLIAKQAIEVELPTREPEHVAEADDAGGHADRATARST